MELIQFLVACCRNIGAGKEWAWASKLGHYWRTGSDVGNIWGQVDMQAGQAGIMYNFDTQQSIPAISAISGPGEWHEKVPISRRLFCALLHSYKTLCH